MGMLCPRAPEQRLQGCVLHARQEGVFWPSPREPEAKQFTKQTQVNIGILVSLIRCSQVKRFRIALATPFHAFLHSKGRHFPALAHTRQKSCSYRSRNQDEFFPFHLVFQTPSCLTFPGMRGILFLSSGKCLSLPSIHILLPNVDQLRINKERKTRKASRKQDKCKQHLGTPRTTG